MAVFILHGAHFTVGIINHIYAYITIQALSTQQVELHDCLSPSNCVVTLQKGARHTRNYRTVTSGLSVLLAATKHSTYCTEDDQKRNTHHVETSRQSLPMATSVGGDASVCTDCVVRQKTQTRASPRLFCWTRG